MEYKMNNDGVDKINIINMRVVISCSISNTMYWVWQIIIEASHVECDNVVALYVEHQVVVLTDLFVMELKRLVRCLKHLVPVDILSDTI